MSAIDVSDRLAVPHIDDFDIWIDWDEQQEIVSEVRREQFCVSVSCGPFLEELWSNDAKGSDQIAYLAVKEYLEGRSSWSSSSGTSS